MMPRTLSASFALVLAGCVAAPDARWPGGGGASTANPGGGGDDGGAAASGDRGGDVGSNCTDDDLAVFQRRGLAGTCWRAPGVGALSPPIHLDHGRRHIGPSHTFPPGEIYWFSMPKEGKSSGGACVEIPDHRGSWVSYLPYADDGYGAATPAIPDVDGLDLETALTRLDGLDQPLCVVVVVDPDCTAGHHQVCSHSAKPKEDGTLGLRVATDILDAGTDRERHRRPDVIGMAPDAAVAELKRRGFTNVEVVEANAACNRGEVCEISPVGPTPFYARDAKITLTVRRARAN
jgi:hypothetical protein